MKVSNRKWIRRIWRHQKEQRTKCYEWVYLRYALMATIALLFNRWEETAHVGDYYDWRPVAWGDERDCFSPDWGSYTAWSTLSVKGFRVVEWSDSSI